MACAILFACVCARLEARPVSPCMHMPGTSLQCARSAPNVRTSRLGPCSACYTCCLQSCLVYVSLLNMLASNAEIIVLCFPVCAKGRDAFLANLQSTK
jgi:hypothetical protein